MLFQLCVLGLDGLRAASSRCCFLHLPSKTGTLVSINLTHFYYTYFSFFFPPCILFSPLVFVSVRGGARAGNSIRWYRQVLVQRHLEQWMGCFLFHRYSFEGVGHVEPNPLSLVPSVCLYDGEVWWNSSHE